MEFLQHAFGSAATAFLMPWLLGAIVLVPFAILIAIARKVQENKMKALLKEFDNV